MCLKSRNRQSDNNKRIHRLGRNIQFSPRFWNRGLKQWNSMALYETLWDYEKPLKCWFDTLWHFMELYDNQGSSTPLTAKEEKAGQTPGFFISGKCKACFSTQPGIKNLMRSIRLFLLWSTPIGEHWAQRSNPKHSLNNAQKRSFLLLTRPKAEAFIVFLGSPTGDSFAQRGNPKA